VKDRSLIYLSLTVSIAALVYAGWIHQHAEQMAVQALRQRERELVTRFAPKVRTVCLDMLGKTNVFATEPTTLEELVRPLAMIMESVGEDTKKATSK
jgi:hypothetical protein